MFKIKTGYYLELLPPEKIKLIGNKNNKITKDKHSKNVRDCQITEVVLVHWNFVNSNYQQDSRVFYTYILNKMFGQLLDVSPKKF